MAHSFPTRRSSDLKKKSALGRKPILDQVLVAAALQELEGNVAAVARRFNVDRTSVRDLIERHQPLQQVMHDAREGMLDAAENSLLKAAKKGEAWAVCFVLKTLGRTRGYIERHEINSTETVRRQIVEEIVDVQITHHNRPDNSQVAPSSVSVPSLPGPV